MEDFLNFSTQDSSNIALGAGFSVKFSPNGSYASIYKHGHLYQDCCLTKKVDKRVLLTDLIEHGAKKSYVAKAFGISRQTLDTYIESRTRWGLEGLINNGKSKSEGNKAVIFREERKALSLEAEKKESLPLAHFFEHDRVEEVAEADQPYKEEHDWTYSRYLGNFVYIILLISQWKWLPLAQGIYGKGYKMLMILLLMGAENVRSIEGLKNLRRAEAGMLLGIKNLPSRQTIWTMFSELCVQTKSLLIMKKYFSYQIRSGFVSAWLWAIDGHLLPYSGKEKVHYAYNTQRKIPVPGRTTQVTTDAQGRVVDFTIEEGKGDMKGNIIDVAKKWRSEHGVNPIFIFDREGYSGAFFEELVNNQISFVTWQKNVNKQEMDAIPSDKYNIHFEYNNKDYSVFEEEYTIKYKSENDSTKEVAVRKIFLWNKKSDRRICCIGWTKEEVSAKDLAECILTRWGASENTFKHMQERHPMNYTPGFVFNESNDQTIANPEIKKVRGIIEPLKKKINKLKIELTDTPEVKNSDGTDRKNGKRDRLAIELAQNIAQLSERQEYLKTLPERINVSDLENYSSFKEIDNEGKNLFDFALASIWNARKMMVEWLGGVYSNSNEVVDLFYAITKCHGWMKTTSTEVMVSLEPLDSPSRRAAQEYLCARFTSQQAILPSGKILSIQVGIRKT